MIKEIAAGLVLFANMSVVQSATYDVHAVFADGGIQRVTTFDGQLKLDGSGNVDSFTGKLSESMYQWFGTDFGGAFSDVQLDYDSGPYAIGDAPLLSLNYMLDNSLVSGGAAPSGLHAVSVFLKDDGLGGADTNVVRGSHVGSFPNISYSGGYDVSTDSTYYGEAITGTQTRNWNAFFTLVFDPSDPTNTAVATNLMEYADCNGLGMMGSTCMTGLLTGGSMGGTPWTLSITEVSAVPVPAAAWLFGGALVSLFGIGRRNKMFVL